MNMTKDDKIVVDLYVCMQMITQQFFIWMWA